jgi:choline dehydrogenase-like flavoprotein
MMHKDAARAEIQPGAGKPSGSDKLTQWIIEEAWGHHACGTCRIGSDPWRAKVTELKDKEAVLDSSFRVHGVRGLRVVDASVFPTIPGYFISVPTFLISEKAAETILHELSL